MARFWEICVDPDAHERSGVNLEHIVEVEITRENEDYRVRLLLTNGHEVVLVGDPAWHFQHWWADGGSVVNAS